MIKRPKSEVGYEHPAKGPHHCEQCTYFERLGPRQCLKVQGTIEPGDWCKLFKPKSKLAEAFAKGKR